MRLIRKYTATLLLLGAFLVACSSSADTTAKTDGQTAEKNDMNNTDLKAIPFETITGEKASLADYAGKVILVVNVASKCGYTKQYSGLEELYEAYKDSSLVVIGFPANNFGGQEPGSNEEILDFCTTNFDVTFPMMAKVSVKGDDKHTLFKEMTENAPLAGEIKWNFSKFLIDRDGRLVARFDSGVEPMSVELVGQIKKLL